MRRTRVSHPVSRSKTHRENRKMRGSERVRGKAQKQCTPLCVAQIVLLTPVRFLRDEGSRCDGILCVMKASLSLLPSLSLSLSFRMQFRKLLPHTTVTCTFSAFRARVKFNLSLSLRENLFETQASALQRHAIVLLRVALKRDENVAMKCVLHTKPR